MISYILFGLLVVVLKYLLKTKNNITLGIPELPKTTLLIPKFKIANVADTLTIIKHDTTRKANTNY